MNKKAIDTLLRHQQNGADQSLLQQETTGSGINKAALTDFVSFAKTAGLYAGLTSWVQELKYETT